MDYFLPTDGFHPNLNHPIVLLPYRNFNCQSLFVRLFIRAEKYDSAEMFQL